VSERTSELQNEIAERKHTDQKLEERTTFFNSLIENTPIAIVAVGIDDIVQFCNPAFEKIFRYRQADVIGKSLLGLLTNADVLSEVAGNRDALWKGKVIHSVCRRARSDGSLVDVEAFSVPQAIAPAPSCSIRTSLNARMPKRLSLAQRMPPKLPAAPKVNFWLT
jgi:PAS domain S-box-containing protein